MERLRLRGWDLNALQPTQPMGRAPLVGLTSSAPLMAAKEEEKGKVAVNVPAPSIAAAAAIVASNIALGISPTAAATATAEAIRTSPASAAGPAGSAMAALAAAEAPPAPQMGLFNRQSTAQILAYENLLAAAEAQVQVRGVGRAVCIIPCAL